MTLSPGRYRAITIAALVALCVIVVTGVAVRLTGSGLGCDDWPQCNSQRLVDVSSKHAAIEQVNRMFTGIVAVAVIAAVLGARKLERQRRDLTFLAWGLVFGVLAQIVLGGITVLVDLHPVAVQGHFLVSMVLVANAVLLVHRAGVDEDEPMLRGAMTWHRIAVTALTALSLLTGTVVTGAGPHAGDEDVQRFGIDISSAARVHSLTVLVTIAATATLGLRLRQARADESTLGLVSTWVFVGILQGAIGYIQYFNDIPELLVAGHVAIATVLWAVTVFLLLQRVRVAHSERESSRAHAATI